MTAVEPQAPVVRRPDKDWSFLAYIAADNNLDAEGLKDVEEIAAVGVTERTHIGIEMDTKKDLGSVRYEITPPDFTRRGYRQVIERLPEQRTGDPRTLRNFLAWAIGRCDAKERILIVWGHGMGRDVAPDDSAYGSALDLSGIEDALQQAGIGRADGDPAPWSAEWGRTERLAILGFDACSMSMLENVCEFAHRAKFVVASQELVPSDGWPYGALLQRAKAYLARGTAPEQVACAIVDGYVEHYHGRDQTHVTLAAIEVERAGAAVAALHALGEKLSEALATGPELREAIRRLRIYARSHFLIDFVDLVHLASLIRDRAEALRLDAVREAADRVIGAVRACVRRNQDDATRNVATGVRDSSGLSVWFPAQRKVYLTHRTRYLALRCNRANGAPAGWVAFLDAYHG